MSSPFSIGWFVFVAVIECQYSTSAYDDNKEVISKRFLEVIINGAIGGAYINSNGNNNLYGGSGGGYGSIYINSNGNNNNNNWNYGGINLSSNGNSKNNNSGYGSGIGGGSIKSNGTSYSSCDDLLISDHRNNANISASSTHSHCRDVHNYQINAKGTRRGAGGWCARTDGTDQYVEIRFRKQYKFRGIITQGRHGGQQWVKQYKVLYSKDCVTFHKKGKLHAANWDESTVVTNKFTNPVRGRCIRINPTKYHGHIAMRFDIIGCEV